MKRYCLANYILTVDIPEDIGFGSQSVSIGGEGSYLDTVSIALTSNLFSTSADNTGSWIHTKNLDKTGTVAITINQMSDKIATFKTLINIYSNLTTEVDGMTLTLRDTLNNTICICEDCLLQKIPDQSFGKEPENQTWTFTCGKIVFVN